MESVGAQSEFHWGVNSFHKGFFNDSIRSFEKSLSFKQDDIRTREWLGFAYYRSGFEETAVNIWNSIIKSGAGTALLQNRVDVVTYRRGLARELSKKTRYVLLNEIAGKHGKTDLFLKPCSVTTIENGNYYVSSFATNEILLFNTNGAIRQRIRGGFDGLDHPFDVLYTEAGYLFITEFNGDRVLRCNYNGSGIMRFGERGRGEGQFLGPQYIANDNKGNIYITDYGNKRVSKFDYNGNFIFSFGNKKTVKFNGLKKPTGIIIYLDKVFVADSELRSIVVFDLSGNYIATLADEQLVKPEGLSMYTNGVLMIADESRIVTFDIENENLEIIIDLAGDADKIMKADIDSNGSIVTVDINSNKIFLLSQLSGMYTGLHVQIENIYAKKFPEVLINVIIENRNGDPFVGLENNNFFITENKMPVGDTEIVYTGNRSKDINLSVLVDRSSGMSTGKDDIRRAVTDLSDSIQAGGSLCVVSAGEKPVLEAKAGIGRKEIIQAAADKGEYSEDWEFDLGLRLAVSQIVSIRGKRAVVFVTKGETDQTFFNNYQLIQLMQYMKNNSIGFYCVYIDKQNIYSQELEYLCRETGGKSYFLYRPEGIKEIVDHILSRKNGLYTIKYNSKNNDDFGKAYIPVEVEAFLFNKSGREISGYFAPGKL